MAVRVNSGVVAVNSPITNAGSPNNASLGLDQTALSITASQVVGTAVIRSDSLFVLNGANVLFGGTVTTSGGSALVVASPITITGGTIGLDQPALSITRSQVSDFTSGSVAYSTTSATATYSTLSGTATFASTVGTANYATTSGTADYSTLSGTATYSTLSGTANYATTSGTASTISGNIGPTQVTGTAVVKSDNLLTVNGTAIAFGGTVVTPADFITAVASPITNTGGTAGLDQTALSIQPSQVVGTAVITTDSKLGAIKVGGTAGQVLAKVSATDYDTAWTTPSNGLTVNNVARMMGWADNTIEPRHRGMVTGLYAPVSGGMTWTQFTPAVDITVSSIAMMSNTTGSSGLTLARMGVYSVNSNGTSGTLLARTASDTTLFNTANTLYTRSFDTTGGYPASLTLTAGTRYAIAQVSVGTTTGNKLAYAALNTIPASSIVPVSSNSATGQTDLPATPTSVPAVTTAGWGRLS